MKIREDELYDQPYQDTDEEHIRSKWKPIKVGRCRLKTIKCNELVEANVYPIWDTQTKREIDKLDKISPRTPEEEREIYERRQRKHVRYLINGNFTKHDTWLTGTFSDDKLPKSLDEARRYVLNYLRRVKYKAKKEGWPEVKAIYVIELFDIDGLPVRCHAHIVINVADRDLLEELWRGGERTQTRRLQPDDFGLTGMALYVTKAKADERNKRRKRNAYGYTTNLYKPDSKDNVIVSDNKITKRMARKMATNHAYAEQVFKRLYPKLRLLDIAVYHNELIDGFYITARFHNDFADDCKNMRRRQ